LELLIISQGEVEIDDNGLLEGETPIRLRIITPELALQHENLKGFSLMPGIFSKRSTLRQIRNQIARHFSLDLHDGATETLKDSDLNECNCSLARAISNKGLFEIKSTHSLGNGIEHGHPYLLIHSKNVIEVKRVSSLEENYLLATVSSLLEEAQGPGSENSKSVQCFGLEPPMESER
jgi:hypothetical protein